MYFLIIKLSKNMMPERRKSSYRASNLKNFAGEHAPGPPSCYVDLVNLSAKKLNPPLNSSAMVSKNP